MQIVELARFFLGRRSSSNFDTGGHLEVLKLLETRGANIQLRDNIETSALAYGVHSGNLEVVRFLLHLGLPVNQINLIGRSPLIEAIETVASNEMVRTLLAAAADPDLGDPVIGVTPMKAAWHMKREDVAEMLIAAGAKDEDTRERNLRP